MCDPSCQSSLQTLQSTQRTQCTSTDTITVSSVIYPPTYVTDLLLDTYHYVCLKNG